MTDDSTLLEHDNALSQQAELRGGDDEARDSTQSTMAPVSLRSGFVVLSVVSAIVFAYIAPLSLSMPFTVVALIAPLLTTCDCRHSRARLDNEERHAQPARSSSGEGEVTEADEVALDEHEEEQIERNIRPKQRDVQDEQQHDSHNASHRAAATTEPAHTASGSVSELSLIRSEERMDVRKERVVTSKLVVRKVVTTEMVWMAVPVRKERLECETVYSDEPTPIHDDNTATHDTATTGHISYQPSPLDTDDIETASLSTGKLYSGDRHNYVGVNELGQDMIELLLCEERPRIAMDVVPVSRVYVTKVPYQSSQLVEMELLKEHIEYIAPHREGGSNKIGLA